jgi:hypothetical protein
MTEAIPDARLRERNTFLGERGRRDRLQTHLGLGFDKFPEARARMCRDDPRVSRRTRHPCSRKRCRLLPVWLGRIRPRRMLLERHGVSFSSPLLCGLSNN